MTSRRRLVSISCARRVRRFFLRDPLGDMALRAGKLIQLMEPWQGFRSTLVMGVKIAGAMRYPCSDSAAP